MLNYSFKSFKINVFQMYLFQNELYLPVPTDFAASRLQDPRYPLLQSKFFVEKNLIYIKKFRPSTIYIFIAVIFFSLHLIFFKGNIDI